MAKGMNILPYFDYAEVNQSVSEAWDMSSGFPLPLWDVMCRVCGSDKVMGRRWHFFSQGNTANPYRCDVDFKCRKCSAVWQHGVVIPANVFAKHVNRKDGSISHYYNWKDVRGILNEEEGVFTGTVFTLFEKVEPPSEKDLSTVHPETLKALEETANAS